MSRPEPPPVTTARRALGTSPLPPLSSIFVHGTRLLASGEGDTRLAILGSVTTDLLARAAAVGVVQEGHAPVVYQAPYGAWRQEALDRTSGLHRFAPDVVIVATDWRDAVTELPLTSTKDEVDTAVAAIARTMRQIWDALRATAPGLRIIQHLPALPATQPAGVGEFRTYASHSSQVAAVRAAFLDIGPDIVFLDTDGLAPDSGAWFAAKLPFAQDQLPEYVARFRSAFRQAFGKTKKVLALDLDNTLWGGVIGDDGVEGLVLGPDSPRGEAFCAFQAYVRALGARGVVLAVCSKNDPAIAQAGFSHPHSVLRRAEFQAFECNWTDKPAALRRIAQQLNVGTDSMVFVDDNPSECALVREAMPEVAVVEVGEDPSEFVARVAAGRWFEGQRLGSDDLRRNASYQARAEAASAMQEATDIDSFLQSLQMRASVSKAARPVFERMAQLEGKTNQFNLTTRRRTLAEIEALAEDDDAVLLTASLSDKFGDHGLVSSLIAKRDRDALVIDSWLMSCRVFSRTLEQCVMKRLIALAAERSLTHVVGEYAPTAKNDVVAQLYSRLGFEEIATNRWQRPVAQSTEDLVTFIEER